jgi:hypothetical protein
MRSRTSLALAGALLMTLLPGAASAAQAEPAATTVAEEVVEVADGTLQPTGGTDYDLEGITDLGDLGDVTVDGDTTDDNLEVDPGGDETTIDGAPMDLVVDQNGEVLGFPYTL